MKSFTLAAVLLATTAVTPLLAADIPAVSKVDAVTVFPSGAEVTRVAEAKISAGEHSLIFEGLPGDLMPETIRVEGNALGTVEIHTARLMRVWSMSDRRTLMPSERSWKRRSSPCRTSAACSTRQLPMPSTRRA